MLCSIRKAPKIPASRMRAGVYTATCLICAKDARTGLTPKYLLENAMAHLQEFHSHVGYLCLNCLTIRSVNDRDHYEKCLHSTSEGLRKGGPIGYSDTFLADAVVESFSAGIGKDDSPCISESEISGKNKDQYVAARLEDVEDQIEWRKTATATPVLEKPKSPKIEIQDLQLTALQSSMYSTPAPVSES